MIWGWLVLGHKGVGIVDAMGPVIARTAQARESRIFCGASNLRAGHFAGPIYAVNPKHARLDAVGVFARRSTQRMVGYVLRENEAMRELAQSQGFVVDAVASDADALFLALTLQAR